MQERILSDVGRHDGGQDGRFDAAFAADLHLQPTDTVGLRRAQELLQLCQDRTSTLYLLGDVFDVWTSSGLLKLREWQPLFEAFRAAAAAGLDVAFLPGNRDFNLTPAHGATLGIEVHGEVLAAECGERRLYLTHGDRFLLNDTAYQRYKRVIRSAPARFLARHLPDFVSFAIARRLRRYSDHAVARKESQRLAIVADAVRPCLTAADTVLCGHVHRAERVSFGPGRELLVLPPFLETGQFLVLEDGEFRLADTAGRIGPFQPPPGPTRP